MQRKPEKDDPLSPQLTDREGTRAVGRFEIEKVAIELAALYSLIADTRKSKPDVAWVLHEKYQEKYHKLAAHFGYEALGPLVFEALKQIKMEREVSAAKAAADIGQAWVLAWTRRHLATLVLAFAPNGTYSHVQFGRQASNHENLSTLIGEILHQVDGTIAMRDARAEEEKVIVQWERTCSRARGLHGLVQAPSGDVIRFEGTTTLEFTTLPANGSPAELKNVKLVKDDWHGLKSV